MADQLDVETTLANLIGAALYPSGTGSPSAVGASVSIYPGWPSAGCLESALKTGAAHVTVFALRGTGTTFQHLDGTPEVAVAPVHNVTAAIAGAVVTLSGTPAAGEVATVTVNGRSYSRSGASVSAIATALLADLAADFPGSSAVGPALTIVGARDIAVRIGAAGVLARQIKRVAQQFMITVWAPTPALRSAIGKLVAVTLVNAYRFALPDGSHARSIFARSDDNDQKENAWLYRRDVVFTVEYAFTEQFDGFEVTSVVTTLDASSESLNVRPIVADAIAIETPFGNIALEDGSGVVVGEDAPPEAVVDVVLLDDGLGALLLGEPGGGLLGV